MIEAITWQEQAGAQVCICAISGRTPLGLSAAASAAAVRGSMSAVGSHPIFIDKMGEPVNMARDAALDPQMPIDQRLQHMFIAVIADVIEALPRRPDLRFSGRGGPLCCLVAVPEARPGLPEYLQETLATAVANTFAWPPISLQVPCPYSPRCPGSWEDSRLWWTWPLRLAGFERKQNRGAVAAV